MQRAKTQVSVALGVLALGCGSAPGSEPPQVPVPVAESRLEPTTPKTPEQHFRANLRDAEARARQQGFSVTEVLHLDGHHAAILLYEPAQDSAPATRLTRFEAVSTAPGAVVSGESGMVELQKTRGGGQLWDLRGDGARFVVLGLTPCGASCGQAEPFVLELLSDRFVRAEHSPTCPTCIQDFDRDRIPEFSFRLLALKVAPCSRVSCGPSYGLEVEVRGIESWEGGRYARDLRDFVPIYFDRLRRAKRDGERVMRAKHKGGRCPLTALRTAAELYVYGRLIGESETDALASADAVMQGYDVKPCSTEFDLLAPPKPWPVLRSELVAAELPLLKLERRRPPARP
ncbi:MAG: hypothetical protein KF718_04565 [Polyangiaceae bacterium]|nr:hypothetical protein [Polyangiaceae bacterium]